MSDPFQDRSLPRGALLGAAALLVFSVAGAVVGRVSGSSTPLPPATVVESRSLLFGDRTDGSIVVSEPGGAVVAIVPSGSGGFMRGVLRGLAQERMRREQGPETPFELKRWSDGRLSLIDPLNDRHVYLEAFGPSNVAAFAVLLDSHAPNVSP
jgi:putative photosynthetic complex assembly protein